MILQLVENVILLSLAYTALGLVFATLFCLRGVQKIDGAATDAGWLFRLLIFPGSALFWPLLSYRWLTASRPTAKDSEGRDDHGREEA